VLDQDGDSMPDELEGRVWTSWRPTYFISLFEPDQFATFKDAPQEQVDQVFGAFPPINHVRVKPLGFGFAFGQQWGYLQVDYFTLWNADSGLIPPIDCGLEIAELDDLLGTIVGGATSAAALLFSRHPLDNEWSTQLLGAPTTKPSTYNGDQAAYKLLSFRTAAHEDTVLDHSKVYLSVDETVPPGLWLSLSKHGTYNFNPNGLAIAGAFGDAASATASSLLSTGVLTQEQYDEAQRLIGVVFYACLVETHIPWSSGRSDLSRSKNIGEVSHPINGSGFIVDAGIKDKLNKVIFQMPYQ
jgi:hypothetical protein